MIPNTKFLLVKLQCSGQIIPLTKSALVFMARSGDRGERGRESVSQGEKEVVHLLDMEDGEVSRVGRRKEGSKAFMQLLCQELTEAWVPSDRGSMLLFLPLERFAESRW